MSVTQAHELKETLTVDVITPGHAPRETTSLFTRTKRALMARQNPPRCWICQRTAEESGYPLEAHHLGVERSFAEGAIDWERVKEDYPHFDWATFDPADPYAFVDNMDAQGLLLCKTHHTGKGTGIHTLPWPLFVLQRYLKDGAQFTPTQTIHHDHL